jgi:pyrimidine precursor biosynthesis enzyme
LQSRTYFLRIFKVKKIGYVGEFGKIQVNDVTGYCGVDPEDDTTVRCGRNVSNAGFGLENVQSGLPARDG